MNVGTGVIYQGANIKVTAVENSHFDFHKGGPASGKHESYSYRFETPDRVIAFTGDTDASDAVTELPICWSRRRLRFRSDATVSQ